MAMHPNIDQLHITIVKNKEGKYPTYIAKGWMAVPMVTYKRGNGSTKHWATGPCSTPFGAIKKLFDLVALHYL